MLFWILMGAFLLIPLGLYNRISKDSKKRVTFKNSHCSNNAIWGKLTLYISTFTILFKVIFQYHYLIAIVIYYRGGIYDFAKKKKKKNIQLQLLVIVDGWRVAAMHFE